MSIEENYLIADSKSVAYSGEIDHDFKPSVSIHLPGWIVVNYPVQCNVEMDILGVLLCLVHIYGWHEALPVGLGKYK